MKVVCDTNVILSAILFGGNPEKILTAARQKKTTIYTSTALLFECSNKLKKKFRWDESKITKVVLYLGSIVTVVKPTTIINLIKDEADNRVLECAFEVKADYIISGDKRHLLSLKQFRGIQIISPAQFLSDVLYS